MFKSCRYCRHRKKKCVWPHETASDARCLACQHLDVGCEIGTRKPSLKRQRRSQLIASRLPSDPALGSVPRAPRPGIYLQTVAVEVKDGDCQVYQPGAQHAADKVIIFGNAQASSSDLTATEKYTDFVSREFPFIPESYLNERDEDMSPVLAHCITFASLFFLGNQAPRQTDAELQHLHLLLGDQDLDLAQAAGILLLLPRVPIDRDTAKKALDAVAAAERHREVPVPIITGSLSAHTWLSLAGHDLAPFSTSPSALLEHAKLLDPNDFARHYLKLTHLAATFLHLRKLFNEEGVDEKLVQSWADLEHASLLNVVEMPSEFLDVRDDLPATPAAVVTHMLQSLIYLHIYGFMLCEKPALGQGLGLRPVPGVLHFICAVARSVFVCPKLIIAYWPLLTDLQAAASRIMLQFWKSCKFENCRALLNLWEPDKRRFRALAQEVQDEIGPGPWDIEVIDGYSVFWTFMDMRNLSLEMQKCG